MVRAEPVWRGEESAAMVAREALDSMPSVRWPVAELTAPQAGEVDLAAMVVAVGLRSASAVRAVPEVLAAMAVPEVLALTEQADRSRTPDPWPAGMAAMVPMEAGVVTVAPLA